MDKTNDFASDLKTISATVESDVGTIMKLVREKQSNLVEPPATTDTTKEQSSERIAEIESPPADGEITAKLNRSRPNRSAILRNQMVPAEHPVLQNVTTRLRQVTNERLTETALRQRLKKESPSTRQGIIEEALHEWFARRGYH